MDISGRRGERGASVGIAKSLEVPVGPESRVVNYIFRVNRGALLMAKVLS